MPVLSGSGIEPAAERGSEFEHCSPFSPCKGAWFGLDRPVDDGGSSAKFVGKAILSGDLLPVGGGNVEEEKYL